MITVLMKISFQYWKRHKRRLCTLATAVIMGVAALCCIALLIRSEKTVLLNQMLDKWGEYDLIVYETQMETAEDIFNTDGVTTSGFYYELGYAMRPDSGKEYKVAAYANLESEELYHASCIRGTYPENAEEVALDIETAKSLGISPYPGEQIELALYDLENQELCTRTFTVSGIFVMSNKGSYGGYFRYPGENYATPTVFVSADMNQVFQTETVTAFVQVENVSVRDAIKALSTSEDRKWLVDNMSFDRTIAYSSVLGNFHYLYLDYGELDIDSVEQSLDDQNYNMDFYSNILMPLLSALVLLIVLISLIELIRNVLKDRAEMLAVLRSIGLSAKGSGIYLTIEFCVLTILLSLVGLLVGMGCHVGMVALLNRFFNTRMSTGFQVSKYVAAVTYNPYSLPLVIIGVSVLGAVLFSVVKFVKIPPVMIFQGQVEQKHRKKRQKTRSGHSVPKGWLPLLNESISLHDTSIIVITIVVMSVAFLGYTYFSALAEKDTLDLEYKIESYGMGNKDYLAQKSSDIYTYNFNTENHHDYGVPIDALQEFAQNEFVDSAQGVIVNISTRLAYPTATLDEAVEQLLGNNDLRTRTADGDEIDEVMYEGQEAFMEAVGYSSEESVYGAPTVGISQKLMEQLSDYVIAGALDWEQIQTGAEVVIVVPESLADTASVAFAVGEELPLSDLVLSEEEDVYDFGYILPDEFAEPVYQKTVVADDSEVWYAEYAFGYRKDILTRVGAVVAVPEDTQGTECPDFIYELVYQDLSDYSVMILCSDNGAFGSWGLPDVLYTKVFATLQENCDIEQADIAWYQCLNRASGMTSYSVSEIKMDMESEKNQVMSIYYAVIVMLIVIGMTAIGINLYSRIRMSSTKIAHLRAIGMSLPQLTAMILRQNLFYPLIGAICALIPVGLLQCLFYYVNEKVTSGQWASYVFSERNLPWYFSVPYGCNLFAYHSVAVLLIFTLVMMGLILLVTIPQILYIRRQRIVEDLEKVSF